MKKFITTVKTIFTIEELRQRIFLTIGFLLIFRLGTFVVLPGVDRDLLGSADKNGLAEMLDIFLGGAFSRASIFALGIMPYISASIVIQLLTVAVPYFQRLQKDGESGRKKISQITRVLTIIITFAQASGYLATTVPQNAVVGVPYGYFVITSMIVLTTGTMFCMWLGEKITEKGIGNGVSMLIMIGIIAQLPGAIQSEIVKRFTTENEQILLFFIEILALFFVVMGVVLLTQAVRRIPLQYPNQVASGSSNRKKKNFIAGPRSFIPLKVNAANVMPIIFAQSLMFVPPLLAGLLPEGNGFRSFIDDAFASQFGWVYSGILAFLIIVFTFFYTAITVNPSQMTDDLKKSGAFIPGIKPGPDTVDFIAKIIDLVTLPGALFLGVVAVLPALAYTLGVGEQFATFYGGTSLIIMVGVVFDTLQQIESYLLMNKYDSMMKGGVDKPSENIVVAD